MKVWVVIGLVCLAGCRSSAEYRAARERGIAAVGAASKAEDAAGRDAKLADAEAAFRAAIAADDRPEARLDLARCLLAQGKADAGDAELRAFVEGAAHHPRAYYEAARSHLVLRAPDRARRWVEAGIGRHPGHPALRLLAGDVARGGGDAEALAAYRGVAEDASVPPAVAAEAWYRVALVELERALGAIDAARASLPADAGPEELSRRMAAMARGGGVSALPAELALRRAVFRDPRHVQAHLLLAAIYHQQRRLESARLELEQALSVDPSLVGASYLIAVIDHAAGRLDAAIARYRSVLAAAPEQGQARVALGLALVEQGATDEGLALLDAAGVDQWPAARLGQLLAQWRTRPDVLGRLADALGGVRGPLARALLTGVRGEDLGASAEAWRRWISSIERKKD